MSDTEKGRPVIRELTDEDFRQLESILDLWFQAKFPGSGKGETLSLRDQHANRLKGILDQRKSVCEGFAAGHVKH